jgi:hypothetical protein
MAMIKKKLLVVSLTAVLMISIMPIVSFASSTDSSKTPQLQWSKTYPRSLNYSVNGHPVSSQDNGRFVVQTSDGGYAIFAELNDHHYEPHTGGVDNRTSMVIRTDSSGELQWEKGNFLITFPNSISQTYDSGFILSGSNQLLKLNAEGNMLWNSTFKGPIDIWGYQTYYSINSVVQTANRGYVCAGFIPNYDSVALLLKTDENGALLWNKTFPASSGWASISALVETDDRGYAVAGYRDGAWLAETDSGGNLKLSQNYPELGGYFNSMAVTKDNGLLLAGGTWTGGEDNQGLALLVKFDAQRKIQWHQTYNNPPWEGSYQERALTSVVQTGDRGYIAVSRDALVKVDMSGSEQWTTLDFDASLGNIASVSATKDEGFIVVGSLNNNVWLAKFAPESAT